MTTAPRETPEKYVPKPDGLNAGFYRQLTKSRALQIQRCRTCRAYQHPPRYRCGCCTGDALDWHLVSQIGTVLTWTVAHRAVDPGWAPDTPTTVLVELLEGPRVVGALRTETVSRTELGPALRGLHVRADVERVTPDFSRIWFLPLEQGDSR